jgi:hypothetical protein
VQERFVDLSKSFDLEANKSMKSRVKENDDYLEHKKRRDYEEAMASAQNLKAVMASQEEKRKKL